MYRVLLTGMLAPKEYSREEFIQFQTENHYTLSSNGILYAAKKEGVIPTILNLWFSQRKEFKALSKQYLKAGDDEQAAFYDRRQAIQKVFLNSIYGVLGLPSFRFYDLDNALAVTATGQHIIKMTGKFIQQKTENFIDTGKVFTI